MEIKDRATYELKVLQQEVILSHGTLYRVNGSLRYFYKESFYVIFQ